MKVQDARLQADEKLGAELQQLFFSTNSRNEVGRRSGRRQSVPDGCED